MTQGFYELLGVAPGSKPGQIREAYAAHAARIAKRRRATLDHQGDPAQLDLARAQLDDAWEVLSDPVRRRKYDAFLAVTTDGAPRTAEEVWRRSAGALVHPAAAAAAELLRVATNLKVGVLPPAPRPSGVVAHEESDHTATDVIEGARPGVVRSAMVVEIGSSHDEEVTEAARPRATVVPPPPLATPRPSLRVVDGTPSAAPVVMMPQRTRVVSAEDLARMTDQHGASGALLRAVREARGLSLEDMADTTRIAVRHLTALERDDWGALPSATFVRGYVREVCKLLGLDADRVTSGFMARYPG